MSVTITGEGESTLSDKNILSANKCTGNTVADITDGGTNTTSYCGIWKYDTGWVACNDWTNQHLGDAVGGNVVHSLGANLSDLLVKVLLSTDGTDANSFQILGQGYDYDNDPGLSLGLTAFQVDTNNITIQTGAAGVIYMDNNGVVQLIDTEAWYYKVKVYHLG